MWNTINITFNYKQMTNETKQIDGYWVIGTNKWNANIYTKEQAEKYAATLIN